MTDFWNLRALGYRVFFLPIDNFREFEKHVRKAYEIGTYRSRTAPPEWIEQPWICFHRNAPQSEKEEIADWIRGLMEVPTVTVYKIGVDCWNGMNLLPHSYYSNEREDIVHVIEGRVEFQTDAPFFYRYSNVWPETIWSNIITIHGLLYQNQYFTRLPMDTEIEKQLRRYILAIRPGCVRLSNEGIVLHQDRMNQHVWLSLPKVSEVIKAMFETAGFEISLSQPGQYAQQIIEKLDGLDGCRMFKVKGVRDALDLLNDGEEKKKGDLLGKKEKKAGDLLGKINRGLSEVPKDLFVEGRRSEELDAQFVFNWMLKHKMMRPGLKFTCTSCTKESWYHVSEFTERFTCRYCFTEQETPRLDNLRWWYRADGLYMLPNKMEGCIPVILTLWRILHHRGSSEAKYTTNILIKDMNNPDKNYELDFVCVFVDSFRGSHEIVLGEARGQVGYTQKDIDKVRSIAKRFENPFLCFSTMKKAFTAVSFKITEQSLESLKSESVPDDVLEKLQSLKNKEFTGEENFLGILKKTIGDEKTVRFKSLILKHAFTADEKQLLRQLIGERYNVINRPRRKSLPESKKLFDEGYQVISLTLEELEPYDLYERFDHLPNKHVVSLEELARNTQMVNLV